MPRRGRAQAPACLRPAETPAGRGEPGPGGGGGGGEAPSRALPGCSLLAWTHTRSEGGGRQPLCLRVRHRRGGARGSAAPFHGEPAPSAAREDLPPRLPESCPKGEGWGGESVEGAGAASKGGFAGCRRSQVQSPASPAKRLCPTPWRTTVRTTSEYLEEHQNFPPGVPALPSQNSLPQGSQSRPCRLPCLL